MTMDSMDTVNPTHSPSFNNQFASSSFMYLILSFTIQITLCHSAYILTA